VHQAGEKLTLVSCPYSYEVYNTLGLALNPYNLQNEGEAQAVRYVRNSREEGREDRLTYVKSGN